MDRRTCLGILGALPLVIPTLARASGYPRPAFDRAIIIDGQGIVTDPYSAAEDVRFSRRGWSEARESGETACSMTVNTVGNGLDVWDAAIRTIATIDQVIADNPDTMLKALTAADIRRAKAEGKLAVIYNTQDTSLVGPELDRIALLRGLGVRIVQLNYNLRNLSGDGCLEPANGGLSRLGRATIERIEHERLLLDLSHSGQRTVAESIAAAARPMTISHTGCRSLNDNPRNLGDAELRACSDKGGVVGIYWMPFLVASGHATGADLVRHMDHAVRVCGEDHVAIGTDGILYRTVMDERARDAQRRFFEERAARGIVAPGEGPDIFNIIAEWDSHLRFHYLADGLSAAGWSSARIEKILGANLMRLYSDVWGG
jgi:membrane dipeptidase